MASRVSGYEVKYQLDRHGDAAHRVPDLLERSCLPLWHIFYGGEMDRRRRRCGIGGGGLE